MIVHFPANLVGLRLGWRVDERVLLEPAGTDIRYLVRDNTHGDVELASFWTVMRERWVRTVSGPTVRPPWPREPLRRWPDEIAPGWFLAYPLPDRDARVYAVAPLHLVLRLWAATWRQRYRWAYWLGFVEPREDGGYIDRRGKWTWRIWQHHAARIRKIGWLHRETVEIYVHQWEGGTFSAEIPRPPTLLEYLRHWWRLDAPWRW